VSAWTTTHRKYRGRDRTLRLGRVASPVPDEEEAPVDPSAIELRYRYHRARRHARVRAKEESRLARYRFYIVMAVLLAIAIAFVVVSWHEIQRLFGI
jgi:hypothetical protein